MADYRRAVVAPNVLWQLLAAPAQAQQSVEPDASHRSPFRIATGSAGISADGAADAAHATGCREMKDLLGDLEAVLKDLGEVGPYVLAVTPAGGF